VTLALPFVTAHFANFYDQLHGMLKMFLDHETLLGCSAGGVIGGGEEVERLPAVTLVAARLPDVVVYPFHLDGPLPDLDDPPSSWERLVDVKRTEQPQFVLLADPFSTRSEALLAGLDYAFPDSVKIGGLASGATSPGLNALFLNEQVYTSGVVGAALSGNIVVDTVVAQGCRPVGPLMQVTFCEGNVIYELDGRPALLALKELLSGLNEHDRRLTGTSLFLGVVMDEFNEEPRAGDFLIRNLIGIDPDREGVAVGEYLQEGMRVRFHLRDADASAEDLHAMLTGYENTRPRENNVSGALLFSCLGRGEYLYKEPNFDTGVFKQHLGGVPVGGFFCNGEIGPVGGTTFLHGYTSSFGLFRPREAGSTEDVRPSQEGELRDDPEPREPEPWQPESLV
jgi:small ligand-binding sensory domain FIST